MARPVYEEHRAGDRLLALSMALSSALLFPSRPGLAGWLISREPARSEVSEAILALEGRVGEAAERLFAGVVIGAGLAVGARTAIRGGGQRVSLARVFRVADADRGAPVQAGSFTDRPEPALAAGSGDDQR